MPDNVHTKFLLNEDEMPRSWYNIAADLPKPPEPVLHRPPVSPPALPPGPADPRPHHRPAAEEGLGRAAVGGDAVRARVNSASQPPFGVAVPR